MIHYFLDYGLKLIIIRFVEKILNQKIEKIINELYKQNDIKKIEELNIPLAHKRMEEAGIQKEDVIVHAPYIINLANTVKPETYQLAEEFLAVELERTAAMGSNVLVLHPGSHVGAGTEAGTRQIIHGLNQVLTNDTPVYIALETMAGKGSEIGSSFEKTAVPE